MLNLITKKLNEAGVPQPEIEQTDGDVFLVAKDLHHAYMIATALHTIEHTDFQLRDVYMYFMFYGPITVDGLYGSCLPVYINWPLDS